MLVKLTHSRRKRFIRSQCGALKAAGISQGKNIDPQGNQNNFLRRVGSKQFLQFKQEATYLKLQKNIT